MNPINNLLENIIGVYTPVTYTDANGIEIIPNGLAGIDFSYLFSCLILLLGLYSIFRIIGIIVSRW